jgi:hypothetical protein
VNHYSARLLVLLVAVAFSACSHASSSHHGAMSFDKGSISFKHDSVVIKARGQEEARVAGDGTLSIGGDEVALEPQAKAALSRYNAQGSLFVDQAMNLGLDSAGFAVHTVGQVFKGLLEGDPDRAGQEAEQGGHALEEQAKALCGRLDQWREAQDAAATAVPQFRPYAVIGSNDGHDCFVDDHHDHDAHHGSNHDHHDDWGGEPHSTPPAPPAEAAPAAPKRDPGVAT